MQPWFWVEFSAWSNTLKSAFSLCNFRWWIGCCLLCVADTASLLSYNRPARKQLPPSRANYPLCNPVTSATQNKSQVNLLHWIRVKALALQIFLFSFEFLTSGWPSSDLFTIFNRFILLWQSHLISTWLQPFLASWAVIRPQSTYWGGCQKLLNP